MQRFVWSPLVLGAMLVLAALPGQAQDGSKKKLSTTAVEIGGARSFTFDHWKAAKADGDVIYDCDPGKTKDLEKMDSARLTITKVKNTQEEVFSDLKQLFDDKAVTRTDKVKAGPLEGNSLFLSGTTAKKQERYRMYAVLLNGKDGKYLVKLIGPGQVVGLHQADLDAFLKALK